MSILKWGEKSIIRRKVHFHSQAAKKHFHSQAFSSIPRRPRNSYTPERPRTIFPSSQRVVVVCGGLYGGYVVKDSASDVPAAAPLGSPLPTSSHVWLPVPHPDSSLRHNSYIWLSMPHPGFPLPPNSHVWLPVAHPGSLLRPDSPSATLVPH